MAASALGSLMFIRMVVVLPVSPLIYARNVSKRLIGRPPIFRSAMKRRTRIVASAKSKSIFLFVFIAQIYKFECGKMNRIEPRKTYSECVPLHNSL